MNEEILQQAGLTKAEAAIYTLLIKNSPCSPPKLADLAGESRTNTYKLLDSLEEKGLVTRDDTQKKLRYWANNPSSLLESLNDRRQQIELAEKRFQDALPSMMAEYFKHSDQPLVQYFHGAEGIQKIIEDQLADGNELYMFHATGVIDVLGVDKSHLLRNQFPARGIKRHMFYADRHISYPQDDTTVPIDVSDAAMLTERTWIDNGDLTEPVEWVLYGNKLAVTSLGNELFGMIIESPQIAASFRQIYDLLDRKVRAEPDYTKRPLNYLYTKTPESLK